MHGTKSIRKGSRVVSPTHRPHLPPGNIPGTHFCQRLSRAQDHSAAGRIMPKKNSSDIGNRNSDLPAGRAAPQPPRAPFLCFRPLIFPLWLHSMTLTCTYSVISLGNIIFYYRPLFSETRQGRMGRAWSMVNSRRKLSYDIKTALKTREDTADLTVIGKRTTCASICTLSQIFLLFPGFRDLWSKAVSGRSRSEQGSQTHTV
jgi:hypothetical protein